VGRSESDRIDESDEVGANVARASGLVTAVDEPGMSSSGRRPPRLAAGHAALILRIGAEEQDRPGALWGSPRASDALVVETTEVPVGIALTHLPSVVGRASASVTLVLVASGILVAGGPKSGQPSPNGGASRGLVPGSPRPAARAEPGDPGAGLENSETRSMQKQIMGVAALGAALAIGDASHAQAVQWKVSDGGNGHWYAVDLSPLWWSAWNDRATQLGARLASITSLAEQQRVEFLIGPMSNGGYPQLLWLGAVRRNCSWAWTSSEVWDFTYWSQGNPNGGCTDAQLGIFVNQTLPQFNLGWDDCICPNNGEPTGAVLEWSADCNGDGIVDYGQCRDGSLPDYNGNNIPDCCEMGTPCVVENYAMQWRSSEGGNGHWYLATETRFQHFRDASQWAQNRGGHLVTLTSEAENSFVANLSPGDFILGGYQDRASSQYSEPAGGWRWVTNEPWTFSAWQPGEPQNGGWPDERGEHYLGWWRFSAPSNPLWNDMGNDMTVPPWNQPWNLRAIVEWSADCNNDGIVDKGQILTGQLADSDNDGVPNVCECICDVFRDFNVNGIDLGILLGQWGAGNQFTVTDFNNDGVVDGIDLGQLLAAWGPCPS
jgi:hypothetical protein